LIRFFGKAFRLVNSHEGGETGYAGLSAESREKHMLNTAIGLGILNDPEKRSQRSREMAATKWRKDRERRAALAASTPPPKIVRRVIIIDHEITAKEAIFYDTDHEREARRKLRQVLRPPETPDPSRCPI
jgi:hypothetical protein